MSIAPNALPNDFDTPETDAPLREDIRLLGRILGDTVREQEGDEVFEIVERIRQTSIRFHRDEDMTARRELEATLDDLSPAQSHQIIRAFSYSRISPTSPRTSTTSAARARTPSRLGAARRAAWPMPSTRARQAGLARRRLQAFFARAGEPGADRPSHRGAAQEHARSRDARSRGCSTSATAAAHAGGERPSERPCAAPC